jgi:hypothetical protein
MGDSMGEIELGSEPSILSVELRNSRPVELVDLTMSLTALGQAYEEFVHSHGFDPVAGNARLYIKELRSGSIIAELATALDQASFFLDYLDAFAGFVTHIDDVTNYFLGRRTLDEKPTKKQAERIGQIIEPVAKDGSANLNMNVLGDGAKIDVHFHISSERANATQNGIRRFLGDSPPITGMYQDQVLILAQVRGDPKAKAGDFGIIERFSNRPVKLRFSSEEVKEKVLEVAYPFDKCFVVDCEVSTVNSEAAQYKIYAVKDTFPKPT